MIGLSFLNYRRCWCVVIHYVNISFVTAIGNAKHIFAVLPGDFKITWNRTRNTELPKWYSGMWRGRYRAWGKSAGRNISALQAESRA